jgi:hypothetical protein
MTADEATTATFTAYGTTAESIEFKVFAHSNSPITREH